MMAQVEVRCDFSAERELSEFCKMAEWHIDLIPYI